MSHFKLEIGPMVLKTSFLYLIGNSPVGSNNIRHRITGIFKINRSQFDSWIDRPKAYNADFSNPSINDEKLKTIQRHLERVFLSDTVSSPFLVNIAVWRTISNHQSKRGSILSKIVWILNKITAPRIQVILYREWINLGLASW